MVTLHPLNLGPTQSEGRSLDFEAFDCNFPTSLPTTPFIFVILSLPRKQQSKHERNRVYQKMEMRHFMKLKRFYLEKLVILSNGISTLEIKR